ncbi:alpha/beta hydrolase [Chondrinema litorale]|uniref:alpha/beta hydrolase n=1 Tax=Chondrinema litorale TaxID=2994555 RepID=UPI002543B9E8|nr:alpha/beta hydrolase [Chondrinema litorale]UZR96119.1 alpha/beta hydrolase [Chondrinema litorale]
MPAKKLFRYSLWIFFILMNVVAYFHAYKFTHFANPEITKTSSPAPLSLFDKASLLFFGVNNPRPENKILPSRSFEKIELESNKKIACWLIKSENSKGTVALFHGFSGEKSSMLDKSEAFLAMGYNTLLVDFMGSGESEGNQTTIGFFESKQVKTCFDYLSKQGEKNIILFGTSMGAVAILKAVSDYNISPAAIIVECPFGSMYKTVCARFRIMQVPTFPMAGLLVFWGGIQNGFWAFAHNPENYAKQVNCPTLLLYGEKDQKVSREEIDTIFSNLKGIKALETYPEAAHENYLIKYQNKWQIDVAKFLADSI